MSEPILIIGASVAGVGAANELRRCGYGGEIVLVDSQPHLPYDRPPLSKAALSSADRDRELAFHDLDHYAEKQIKLRLGSPVTAFSGLSRVARLADGSRIEAAAVIIATGARARPFPKDRSSGTIHMLRDLEDAVRLRYELVPGRRLAIVGGGFIGAEVASSAAAMGVKVVLIEASGQPLERALGSQIADRLARLHRNAGIELLCNRPVERIKQNGPSSQRLYLADGSEVDADIVVAGLGSLPNIEWLDGSGLTLGNGILCDEHGRTNLPNVFAAGDVAAWWNPRTREHERHEHWTAAREQARIVAQAVAGVPENRWEDFVAYFWSDMHGSRVQLLGSTREAETIDIVFEDPARGSLVAEFHRSGQLIGVVGINAAGRTMRYAARLAATVANQSQAVTS